MNRDDIIKMAQEAGFMQHLGVIAIPNVLSLERFSAIVAAAEREACANLCEMIADNAVMPTANECAKAIRRRRTA